jgi:hypothetical protein
VCPAGTSLDDLGHEVVETTGTLSLDGITEETFESAKADIIEAIKQQVYDKYGIWLDDDDIELSASDDSSRRALESGLAVIFIVAMPADISSDASTNASNSSNTSSASSASSSIIFDATDVSNLVVASVQSDAVAAALAALNVSTGALIVKAVGEPTQAVTVMGNCPAGKYAYLGECTDCAPGRTSPEGSSNCSNCEAGTHAEKPGSPKCPECASGYYQNEPESTVCLRCRAHALTVDNGTRSSQDCVCEQDYFDCTNPADNTVCDVRQCNKCPHDAVCSEATTLESLHTKHGFWRAINNRTVFHACPKIASCKGGPIVNGSRDSQCASGYVGVRCELCDYENGYAIHQPRAKCSKCAQNEGTYSLILAIGSILALSLLFIATRLGLWPRRLSRVKKVTVVTGPHAGRIGEILDEHTRIDELNFALGARVRNLPPPIPNRAFALFSDRRRGSQPDRRSSMDLRKEWENADTAVKARYEALASIEEEQYALKLAEFRRKQQALDGVYKIQLCKDDQHDGVINVGVCGADLRLRTLNLQELYQERVTKLKITVQFIQICLRLSGTYRFPLPPLTIEFLSYFSVFEVSVFSYHRPKKL